MRPEPPPHRQRGEAGGEEEGGGGFGDDGDPGFLSSRGVRPFANDCEAIIRDPTRLSQCPTIEIEAEVQRKDVL